MPLKPLSLRDIKSIEAAVDMLFDRAKVRMLGPKSLDKRIVASFKPELSLPGIFVAATKEEGVRTPSDVLHALMANAGNYIDAYRHQTKAQVVKNVQAFLHDAAQAGVETDVKTVLGGQLADVWGKTTGDLRRMLDTESTVARNMGTLEGIVKVNASQGIEDPVVYFVVVRDASLCEECRRLHLMPSGKPRVWRMSEVKAGFHKLSDDVPSIGGLHPHCRCSMVTLMPGYGFNRDGEVTYIKRDHDEFAKQRA